MNDFSYSKVGRYEIRKEIKRGGMARVFLAHDPFFDREVAVKVLPREYMDDTQFRMRFEREAKFIAAVEHPAIVPVYDFGEQDGQPYLVMRLMQGGSLHDRLSERSPVALLSLEESAGILKRICSALDLAHRRGIIHRDLKPGNILFDEYGEAYLTDFGIAKHISTSVTLTGSLSIGTPAYMSPEQARGEPDIDSRADVYSLGAILFEMLTGRVPFEADTPTGQMLRHITDPVPNILALRKDLPIASQLVIERSMAKRREARYATAGELYQAVLGLASPATLVEEAPPRDESTARISSAEVKAAYPPPAARSEAHPAELPPHPTGRSPQPAERQAEPSGSQAQPRRQPLPPSREVSAAARPPARSEAPVQSHQATHVTPIPGRGGPGSGAAAAFEIAGKVQAPLQRLKKRLKGREWVVVILAAGVLGVLLCFGGTTLVSAALRLLRGEAAVATRTAPVAAIQATRAPAFTPTTASTLQPTPAGFATLLDAGGEGLWLGPEGNAVSAKVEQQVRVGDRLETRHGIARLELSDGARLVLGDYTALVIESAAGPDQAGEGTRLALEKGWLLVKASGITVTTLDGSYRVAGEGVILGVVYEPLQDRFLVDCFSGSCFFGNRGEAELAKAEAGSRGGFTQGDLVQVEPLQAGSWQDLAGTFIPLPDIRPEPSPAASNTPQASLAVADTATPTSTRTPAPVAPSSTPKPEKPKATKPPPAPTKPPTPKPEPTKPPAP